MPILAFTLCGMVHAQPVQTAPDARVLNGIDVWERDGFRPLQGLRVGLVTNHTGRNLQGRATIDVLKEAANLQLVALFSPEHGIRGELDQENIADSVDEKTGLPIHSLYGKTRRPTPAQLAPLDAVVFDIQDIGTRFYTYISTLLYVLEEAAKAGKPAFVLDRPNPINGLAVEGPLADADKLSFVAAHTLLVRHGMTIGELALMFNQEREIGADVRVVKMENWRRAHGFDQLNQMWVNPSPNMRSLTQAMLYPGVGLLEYTNLSVGRGTDTPFERVGAPYIDARALALHLNARGLAGVRFVPVRFRPAASVFKDEWCGGVNIVITDRAALRPVRMGLELAAALRQLYQQEWNPQRLLALLVNAQAHDALVRGEQPQAIEAVAQAGVEQFKARRAQFLLY
ncbi:MAG: exo-beta-N-acetylmuramidase NamZ domain-containing protein [Rubrivivax sp.]